MLAGNLIAHDDWYEVCITEDLEGFVEPSLLRHLFAVFAPNIFLGLADVVIGQIVLSIPMIVIRDHN